MPRAVWPLVLGRPVIAVDFRLSASGNWISRELLADTGAGSTASRFELVLGEADCLLYGGAALQPVTLAGACAGKHPVYRLRARIPALSFSHFVRAVGVPKGPPGFGGIAAFSFLN